MKKIWIKPLILTAVFIAAVITFSIFMNQSNEDLTTSMPEASLPVLSFEEDGLTINTLHGYMSEMDETAVRDGILPVGADRKVAVGIDTYGNDVSELSYEIRSMDGERLVADGGTKDFSIDGQRASASLELQNILSENEEYVLVLTLNPESKAPVYYYTRIMQTTEYHADECLEFAQEFHNKTFDKDSDQYFMSYIDATTGDSTNLNYVDLTCTINQITWGDFPIQQVSEPLVSFKELNDSYNVLVLKTVLSAQNATGETEYYNAEEYFRLRQVEDRMYVLNYERTVNQIFRGENSFLTDSGVKLGIRDKTVEHAVNESGDTVAFVQQGELWSYNTTNSQIIPVFSFRGLEEIDERENYDAHDIKIVRIDEAGSIDFVVYGYMNRGTHEGETGVGVYHYDGLAHTVEEEAFIPAACSYEILKAEMGQLMYENDKSQIYLMLEGTVYQIDLGNLKTKAVVNGLKDGYYTISDSNRYLAWLDDGEQNSSTKIHLMDLKSGKSIEVMEQDGVYLRPLGFIDEDFVYGIADAGMVVCDAAGNTAFPMKTLKIMDTSEGSGEILKEYSPPGAYIGSITVNGYTIQVQLIAGSGSQYASAGTDSIMNREADTDTAAFVTSATEDIYETVVSIALKNQTTDQSVKLITPKEVILDKTPVVSLEQTKEKRYYVYAAGKVTLATDSISEAIRNANEELGVVLDEKQQYVWMRARKNYQSAFSDLAPAESDAGANSIVKCISAMLEREGEGISVTDLTEQGYTPKQVLENTLKNSVVFDLTGCTVEEIIFYVSCQKPVFAMTDADSAVLVCGYTAESVSCYDPDSGQTRSMSMEEADQVFSAAGNVFFTYLDK